MSVTTNELIVTALLLQDVHFTESQEIIGKFLNRAMLNDPDLKELHGEQRIFKGYVFSNFYPVEKSGKYQSEKVYVFRIRAVTEKLLKKFKRVIGRTSSTYLKVLSSELKIMPRKHIDELYTVNPVLLTTENQQPFLPSGDLSLLSHAIEQNLEKKLRFFTEVSEPSVQPLVKRVVILNRKPIKTRYKHMSLLGNKCKISVAEDEHSQKLAQIAVDTGVLEKNSILGAGFVLANFTKN